MNWNDLKLFLAVARAGQILGASTRLGISQAKLSRHIAALESDLNAQLLSRSTRGSTLTEDGLRLFSALEKAEAEILAGAAQLGAGDVVSGTVRIGTPDAFGTSFLAPRMGLFRSRFPTLRVQLVPIPHAFSLSEREADIAVLVGRPRKGRLKVQKLTDYTLGFYAARSYLETYGSPHSFEQLSGHERIGYVDDLLPTDDLSYDKDLPAAWKPSIEISTAIGQLEATVGGHGIGICHTFAAQARPDLKRVLPEFSIKRSYWLAWHQNLDRTRRVRATLETLKSLVRENVMLFSNDQQN